MRKITLIDLNNFAYYPTLSIGYLIALLKESNYNVSLISPLSKGIKSKDREKVETKVDYVKSIIKTNNNKFYRQFVNLLKTIPFFYNRYIEKNRMFKTIIESLNEKTELVLVSTYTENIHICKKLAQYLEKKNIPMIVGGPAFNDTKEVQIWIQIKGINVLFGNEAEEILSNFLLDYFNGKDISNYPGVYTKNHTIKKDSCLMKDINSLPIPDFKGFPWNKYPYRIIPYMTARGCGWGKCNFCTDVTYIIGRSFRSFTPEKVISDLSKLSTECNTNYINFTDSSLNSNLKVWNTIINELPKHINNLMWFCSVYVNNKENNGLDRATLQKAKKSGLLRITFGLESGSQRLLDHMNKGTNLNRIETFINDIYDVGISLRTTMFIGYPYENDKDLKLTYEFLKRNEKCFDRINIGRFSVSKMAPIYNQILLACKNKPLRKDNYPNKRLEPKGRKYFYYKLKLLRQINKINSKPLRENARNFDGIM